MEAKTDFDAFLKPKSVAVIGATQRPRSWGSFIMEGILSWNFPGKIYPINKNAKEVYGIPAYKDIRDIKDPVDLAIFTIPEESVEDSLIACGEQGVKGIVIITSGFGEAVHGGRKKEETLAKLARSYNMRLLGPNVSGIVNLHAKLNAAASPGEFLLPTNLAGISQGGFALYDLFASGSWQNMGVGMFIHTGNECDLTVTDFLDHLGKDPEVKAILMYLETIRDVKRFMKTAFIVSRKKPLVVHKAGRTLAGSRAASSHTGALAGKKELFEALLNQSGAIISPTMELLLPLTHALAERPAMKGKRVGIVTMGGSWGVALTDSLEEEGLIVPELSAQLQSRLRSLGMPVRASTKNPVDIGASGIASLSESLTSIGKEIMVSGEVDALVLHGFGRPGMLKEDTKIEDRLYFEFEMKAMKEYNRLEKEFNLPVLIANYYRPLESQASLDLTKQGIRVYNRLDEIAQILSRMHTYWAKIDKNLFFMSINSNGNSIFAESPDPSPLTAHVSHLLADG